MEDIFSQVIYVFVESYEGMRREHGTKDGLETKRLVYIRVKSKIGDGW